MKRGLVLAGLCLIALLASGIAGCARQGGPGTGGGGEATPTPAGALVSAKTDAVPNYDGVGDEAGWQDAPETTITVTGGANKSATEVRIKSVYTDDTVNFLMTWSDPTQSFLRSPWEKQSGGGWSQLKDPNDRGGDNNVYYEDKMALIWSIGNSIEGFDTQGCNVTCHAGENPDQKPYGNKYTKNAGETGDIWHWKSVRNVMQVDDQYLDDVRFNPDDTTTVEAGRHSDPNTGGGYVDNKSADGKLPAFMLPEGSPKDGSPGFITDEEKVPFKDSGFNTGDRIPGVVVAPWQGDRGDISAGWKYENGTWTLEFGRKLDTGSDKDVQFTDLDGTYYFGTAIFDNCQVRHATEQDSTPFVFEK